MHVSTAFAHSNLRYIKEQFYSGMMTGDNAFKLTECLDEHTLNTLTPTIIKGYPNTYTYTKVLAEDVVQQHAQKLPVTIFRPGIGKLQQVERAPFPLCFTNSHFSSFSRP